MALSATIQAGNSEPRRKLCLASLGCGLTLGGIALAAMCIDLLNNYGYGVRISPELAGVMVLAAIGVTALPAAAALSSWNWLLRCGTVASVLLTVWAAISAYAERQGHEILARQASNAAYEAAQADAAAARAEIEAARAEASRIAETLTAGALEAMVAEKQAASAREEARGGCGSKCEVLKGELAALLARLGQARAKEVALTRASAAEKRLEKVMAEAKTGPAEASMLASVIAARSGHEARDIARLIALVTTGFAIFVTILMAGLMHQSVKLIKQGLGLASAPRAAAIEKAPQVEPAKPETEETDVSAWQRKPKHRPVQLTPAERTERFIAGHIHAGDDNLRSARLYEEFKTWWFCHAPGQPIPSQRAFYLAMTARGFRTRKRGGVSRYENVRLVPLGVE